jgi:NADPH2:quinone reductase
MIRGSYAEYAAVPARNLVAVPDRVTLQDAAAVLLQGMTAHYLTRSTFPLKPGDVCLVHAAAGGTGSLIVQLARIAGATVIGAVGSAEKGKQAQELGAQHVINYNETDFVSEVKRITNEKGVAVVYDSVGAATFRKSLDCLRPRGMMVSFGNASGPVEPISPLLLTEKGSLFLTRPSLAAYVSDPEEFRWRTSDLFGWLEQGKLRINIHHIYPLADAAAAHRDLESRKTSGKLLIDTQ